MNILLTGSEGNLGAVMRRQALVPVTGLGVDGWADLDAAIMGVDVVVHAASDLRTQAAVAPGRVYAQVTAFVYPALYEGMGGAGILFEQPEELRAAMGRIVQSESLRTRIVEKGYAQCQRFTWQQCALRTIQAYKRAG